LYTVWRIFGMVNAAIFFVKVEFKKERR